jgi:predicted amidohydrolase YtcJ
MSELTRLFTGAELVTMAGPVLHGATIAVTGDRIVAVGDDSVARAAVHRVDEEIDLTGLTVVPGFVDGHCHLEMTCLALQTHVPLHAPPFTTIAGMLTEIERVRRERPTGWIVFRSSFTLQDKVAEGRLPHRDELDLASPNEPIVVLAGLHVACLNSAAMKELGLERGEGLPYWMTFHRDSSGEPTGTVTEVWDRLPTATVEEAMGAIRTFSGPTFSAHGVTSVNTISTSADDVRALHRLSRAGSLGIRTRFYVHVPRTATIDEVLAWGAESGFGDTMLRFGGVKIFVDGEGTNGLGVPLDDTKWSKDELFDLVQKATDGGVQLMMHAVTPRAIRLACEAVVSAQKLSPRAGNLRHRIEHAGDYLDTADLPQLKSAGVGIVATPHFSVSDGAAGDSFQPLRSIVDSGQAVIGATDATGTVPEGVSPLYNIGAAVTRCELSGTASPHRLTVDEAMKMFTKWSAYGCHEEAEKGSIEQGKFADFAVLSANPYRVRPEQIKQIRVERTIVGGNTVFERATNN